MALVLVYDGECPLCSQSAKAVRLTLRAGKLILVNARTETDHPIMAQIKARHLDLNKGIVVEYKKRIYFAANALSLIAELSDPADPFNYICVLLFKARPMAKFFYPFLRILRDLSLMISGKKPI